MEKPDWLKPKNFFKDGISIYKIGLFIYLHAYRPLSRQKNWFTYIAVTLSSFLIVIASFFFTKLMTIGILAALVFGFFFGANNADEWHHAYPIFGDYEFVESLENYLKETDGITVDAHEDVQELIEVMERLRKYLKV